MRIELQGVTKSYAGQPVLTALSLCLEEVHSLVLIGPSGGGKSTLLRLLGGLEAPEAGLISLHGQRLPTGERELRAYRRTIGTVFQSANLFWHLTALENITLPLVEVHRLSPAAARERARAGLARFGLEAHAGKHPGQLSGGQQQRVAIARALALRPRLLLLDEPTSALDPEMTAEVLETIAALREEGQDLVLVTHQMAFAREVGDQVAFLHGGQLLEVAPARTLFAQPREEETRRFLRRVLRF